MKSDRQLDPPGDPVNVPIRTWAMLRNYQTPDERLEVGGSAAALLGRYTQTNGYIFEDNVTPVDTGLSETTIYDPFSANFILPSEKVPVIWDPRSSRWEIDGSWGLERQCVVVGSSGVIDWLGSGAVTLWVNGAEIYPQQQVTAHFKWMGQVFDTVSGEVWIKYVRGASRWEITAGGCA